MFIGWINQLMAMLDKSEAHAVQPIIKRIAELYPQVRFSRGFLVFICKPTGTFLPHIFGHVSFAMS